MEKEYVHNLLGNVRVVEKYQLKNDNWMQAQGETLKELDQLNLSI